MKWFYVSIFISLHQEILSEYTHWHYMKSKPKIPTKFDDKMTFLRLHLQQKCMKYYDPSRPEFKLLSKQNKLIQDKIQVWTFDTHPALKILVPKADIKINKCFESILEEMENESLILSEDSSKEIMETKFNLPFVVHKIKFLWPVLTVLSWNMFTFLTI